METTRGNRPATPGFTRETEIARLRKAICDAVRHKGAILIPTFALGRTQEILALLALMIAEGDLQPQPIYIGGLGRVFTEIYDLEAHRTHRQFPSLQLHEALNLTVLEQGQAEKMKLSKGRIFVITAGMMSENTAAHELGLRMIGDENQHIFFVGYTDPDTPGGRLRAAKHGETFVFSPSGGRVTRRCHIENFDLTAHANRKDMLDFAFQAEPRAVLLVHGDADSRAWLRATTPRTPSQTQDLPAQARRDDRGVGPRRGLDIPSSPRQPAKACLQESSKKPAPWSGSSRRINPSS